MTLIRNRRQAAGRAVQLLCNWLIAADPAVQPYPPHSIGLAAVSKYMRGFKSTAVVF